MIVGTYELSEEIITGLCLRYPNVNVREQLALMALWLAKNPSRAPKRPIRFVENWLKKSTPKLRAVPKIVPAWWQSDSDTLKQGELVGVKPRPGEEMHEYRKRIRERMAA